MSLGACAGGRGQGTPLDRKERQFTGVTLKTAQVKQWVFDMNKSDSPWLIRVPCLGLYFPGPLFSLSLGACAVGRGQGTPLDRKDRQFTDLTPEFAQVKKMGVRHQQK